MYPVLNQCLIYYIKKNTLYEIQLYKVITYNWKLLKYCLVIF